MKFENKVDKFNYFEILYFNITLGILGAAFLLFGIVVALLSIFDNVPQIVTNIATLFVAAAFVNFIITVVRVFKYIFSISKLKGHISITRSIVALLVNPISFIILYVLVIIIALSSCTVQ